MSDQTYAALEAAIRAHIEDAWAGPRIVTEWALTVAHVGAEQRETGYTLTHSDGAPHAVGGLYQYGVEMYDRSLSDDEEGR